jgi:hypothetical protein
MKTLNDALLMTVEHVTAPRSTEQTNTAMEALYQHLSERYDVGAVLGKGLSAQVRILVRV